MPFDVHPSGRGNIRRRFDDRPLLVFWETTKACRLACVHCRASAQRTPGPDELSTADGRALVDELASVGSPRPILVLTGGDCLERADIVDIAAYATARSVPVAVAPSVTPRLGDRALRALRSCGVRTASLSLDGATAGTHERVRGIAGHFGSTLEAISALRRHGFTVQVNTTVMASNLEELADIAALVVDCGVDIWEVFFLVATGRGIDTASSTPRENEDVCHFLVDASRYGFTVRTVEAPFFRRIAAERRAGEGRGAPARNAGELYGRLSGRLVERLGGPRTPMRAPSAATRDGKGVIFVAANGDVHPSGFLPLRLGNVRERGLLEIYRTDSLLRRIRDARFTGECGACEHAELCGGSRSRAYAVFGDPLASDPACARVAAGRAPTPEP
ncbi:MAG TPA: TIGR04053 family radical SAM/SPASM domain-containing protein [Acidimicrobiales bacterium]|nr:TIGR04053 family radical SAM/SPASM domain-containing protein [Acidimicrobiales bacterium]